MLSHMTSVSSLIYYIPSTVFSSLQFNSSLKTDMHLLISLVFCLAIVSVSTENEATCDALDQLAQNVNRDFLHQCTVDGENCVFVRCRARGTFANFFRSITFSVQPCAGLEVDLIEVNGLTAFREIVTTPTIITRSFNTTTISINLQVNMTSTSLTILADPVTISSPISQLSGSLVGFTSIPIDQSGCRNRPSPGIIVTSPTPRSPSSTITAATTTIQPQIVVPNVETCAGFQRLARNVNPQLLSNCGQNSACTQITCQAMGQLSIEVDAVSIMLDVCKNNTAPGVIFELLRDERAVFNQRISSSTRINYSKVGTATIEAAIFLNSTNSSIGISMAVTISEQSFIGGSNSLSATLLNFTQVPFNMSYCYIGLQDSRSTGTPVVATFELILLALALTVALSLVHLNIFDILCLFV